MDIDGLGPAVLNQLIDKGLVQTAADLYDLTAADIAPLDHMGENPLPTLWPPFIRAGTMTCGG